MGVPCPALRKAVFFEKRAEEKEKRIMLREQDGTVRVAKLLFDEKGEKIEPWVVEVFQLITQESEFPDYESLYDICLERCGCGNPITFQKVSRIIVAVTAYDPHRCHNWFKRLAKVFVLPVEKLKEVSSNFFLGYVLGLFQSGLWIDEYWHTETDFEKHYFIPLLQDLVSCQFAPALNFDDGDRREHDYDTLLPAYESELSKAVKAYIRPGKKTEVHGWYNEGLIGRRLALAQNFMRLIVDRSEQEKDKIPKLGQLLLKQVAFAVAGGVSGLFLAEALSDRFEKLFQSFQSLSASPPIPETTQESEQAEADSQPAVQSPSDQDAELLGKLKNIASVLASVKEAAQRPEQAETEPQPAGELTTPDHTEEPVPAVE